MVKKISPMEILHIIWFDLRICKMVCPTNGNVCLIKILIVGKNVLFTLLPVSCTYMNDACTSPSVLFPTLIKCDTDLV